MLIPLCSSASSILQLVDGCIAQQANHHTQTAYKAKISRKFQMYQHRNINMKPYRSHVTNLFFPYVGELLINASSPPDFIIDIHI